MGVRLIALVFLAAVAAGDDAMTYDTIVVGMGAAGTTAASTLAKRGRKVLALEAQDRVGGRVYTVPFGEGVVEVGAEWIHGQYPSFVYETAVNNNITTLTQDLEFKVYRSDGTLAGPAVDELMKLGFQYFDEGSDVDQPLGDLVTSKMTEHIRTKHPELLEDKDFLVQFLDFLNLAVDSYEASNDWNDVNAKSDYEAADGNQHVSWHSLGYKTFFDIMLNKYQGGPGLPTLDIKLNTEVTQIKWSDNPAAKVTVYTKDGAAYTADNVIVTVSLGVLKERYTSLFSPALPPKKASAIDKIQMGVIGKVILSFPTQWWPKKDGMLFLWTSEDKKKVPEDEKWITNVSALSASMGSSNVGVLWTSGNMAKLRPTAYDPQPPLDESGSDCCIPTEEHGPPFKISRESRRYITTLAKCGHMYLFSPPLSEEKVNAIKIIDIGVIHKIILSFPNRWWSDTDYYGFLWHAGDKNGVQAEDEWTTRIFGASCPLGARNCLTLWTNGEVAKMIETLPDEVVKTKCTELLRRFLGKNLTVPEPTGMIRTKWFSNPYTRGTYSYDSMAMAAQPHARSELAAPLVDSAGRPRVLFAGEATNEHSFGTVHGAASSGLREATRLLENKV